MTRNLHVIIGAVIAVYAMTLVAAWSGLHLPSVKEIALLVLGGLLAIMRPQSNDKGNGQ